MKKIYLLPNVITAFALTCGLFVIFKINMTGVGEANQEVLTATAGILLLAAFADLLDGAVARAMKAESEFGGLFDSLADAITFGVAPSVIILKSFSILPGTELSYFLTSAAMIYSVCGVLRLARYNANIIRIKEGLIVDLDKKHFTGLPIPAAAAAAVSANLFFASDEFNHFFAISGATRTWIILFMMIVLGYFMVSRWKFPSLKTLHIKVSSFRQVFFIVIFAVFIFYGILHHFPLAFFGISWTYVIIAWILSIVRLISGKKSKTLEEFEPEPDDLDTE